MQVSRQQVIELTEPVFVGELQDHYGCFKYIAGLSGGNACTHPTQGGIWAKRDGVIILNMHYLRSKSCAIRYLNGTDNAVVYLHKIHVLGSLEPGWKGFWFFGHGVTFFPKPWPNGFDQDSLVELPNSCNLTILIQSVMGSIIITSLKDVLGVCGDHWPDHWPDHIHIPGE